MKNNNDDSLEELINYIKVYHAVVVWGAGASYDAGMPLAGQLPPLVWSTLDKCISVRKKFANYFSNKDTYAMELVGEDWNRIMIAFKFISNNNKAVKTFKKDFIKMNNLKSTSYSAAHSSLVNLTHEGFVEYIVSLNWDSFIEDAWKAKYGILINSDKIRLSKPHGDVYNKNGKWILPHEDGYISEEVKEISKKLAEDYPRILVIIGYSESDDVIVNDFIKPLQNKWKVYRIGPNVDSGKGIRATANEVLKKIETKLCKPDQCSMLENITFENQVGIEPAIRGIKLGPQNVESCTILSQVENAIIQLKHIHYVVIEGESGSGKSITAYQVAYEFFKDGWEVKRPKKKSIDTTNIMEELHLFKTKSVVIIDDAQLYDEHLLLSLKENANDRLKIIICTTMQNSYSVDSIRISNSCSVEELSRDYIKRKEELLPVIKEYDSHIGDGYLDTPIEKRIKQASEANSPWLFNFIMRGGWRSAKSELNILKDYDGADKLLFIIAMWQVVHTDYPISKSELDKICLKLHYHRKWIDNTLEILLDRKSIVNEDGYQCPHMEFSSLVIKFFLNHLKKDDYKEIISIVNNLIMSDSTPMLGISWLLNKIRFSNNFYWLASKELFNQELIRFLQKRWDNSYSSMEKRDSIFVIDIIYSWGNVEIDVLKDNKGLILSWIKEADFTTAYALSKLINSIINSKDSIADYIIKELDPVEFANNFNNSIIKNGYTWGELLDRLYYIANEQWRKNFIQKVNITEISDKLTSYHHEYLDGLGKLITSLYQYNKEYGYFLLDECIDIIKKRMNIDQLAAFEELEDIRWMMLNEPPSFLRRTKPNRKQKQYSRKLIKLISFDKLAKAIEKSKRRDWERYGRMVGEWMWSVDKRYSKNIVKKIDLDILNENTQGYWEKPSRELRILLHTLSCELSNDLAKRLVEMNKTKIKSIDPITSIISPKSMLYVISHGGIIDLNGHNGSEWEIFSFIVERLDNFNKKALAETYDLYENTLIKNISNVQKLYCVPEFINFIKTVQKYLPKRLKSTFLKLSIDKIKKSWGERLKGNSKEKKTVYELYKLFKQYRIEDVEELSNMKINI